MGRQTETNRQRVRGERVEREPERLKDKEKTEG